MRVLIHTRLQPGDRDWQKNGKPFKRFPNSHLVKLTGLKPGVNETQSDSVHPVETRGKSF